MGRRLRLLGLAALLSGSGVLHFVAPEGYRRIVPRALGHSTEIVAVSGVAELLCATLLLLPRTRRAGALLSAALFVAVFPANIQMALDSGVRGAGFPLDNGVVAWLRLPLQAPLIWAAVLIARERTPAPAAGDSRGHAGA